MKVFIRSSDLTSKAPVIIASYDDNAEVSDDAHGPGMTVLSVPKTEVVRDPDETSGMLVKVTKLAHGWRERSGEHMVSGEARRRVEEVLPAAEQVSTLRELLELVLKNGTDIESWPQDAKTRKAEIDDAWNYVRDVRQRARSQRAVAGSPTDDKIWPTRIKKR